MSAHHDLHLVDRHAEFLGGGLGEFRARTLADLDLAAKQGDDAVLADVQPLREVAI